MTFKEARAVSETENTEVRRKAWPRPHAGIIWDEATVEDKLATDWYRVVQPIKT